MKKSSHIPVYRNSKLPAEKRVQDLFRRMTLDEKAVQMMCGWQKRADDWGKFEQSYL